MSWEDQGRQQHQWFGHGTAGAKTKDGSGDARLFGPDGLSQRIKAVAHAAVAALPPKLRRKGEEQNDGDRLARFTEVMTAWSRGAKLDNASFADRFFGRDADDPVVEKLRSAALGAALATSHAELRDAAENLADAMQRVELDRWSRFMADAQARARDPATVGGRRKPAAA